MSTNEKVMVGGSIVAVVFSLVAIVANFRFGVATIASGVVVVLSTTFLLLIFRGARARSTGSDEREG
ncbi:MAG: hypothetical protein ACJ796_16535 [Gemmatimonadaceae bacterium]